MDRISDILQQFSPISLEEMESVKLMNRVDTKYVTTRSQLTEILRLAQEVYFAQQIGGERIAEYDTLYFDTLHLDMYTAHHNRHLARQKVRIRRYVGSPSTLAEGHDLTFLEIKNKNNKGRTKKKRIEVEDQQVLERPTSDVTAFMEKRCRYEWIFLMPQLRTSFRRITLVNKQKTERLTIDMHLGWDNRQTGISKSFDELVIIELKRDGNSPSPMLGIMQQLRIKPMKISKYCVGTALTNPTVKQNRFKAKVRKIERLVEG